MQLKLRRVVRTPRSEMIGLFDLDEHDEADQPINFGLLHVHYLADEVRGTLLLAPAYWQRVQHLLWQAQQGRDSLGGLARNRYEAQEATDADTRLIDFADIIMHEVCEPVGVPSACRVLICFVQPGQRQFLSNSPTLVARDQAHDEPDEPTDVGPRTLFN